MYKVYADDTLIFDDVSVLEELKLIDPVLTMEDNAAGSLKFTMPPNNPGYSLLNRLSTSISVTKKDDEIWAGRVVSESTTFLKNKQIVCEGELAMLGDTIIPPKEYHDYTPRQLFDNFLNKHNSKVPSSKQFLPGSVTVTDPNNSVYRYTNYEKTLSCLIEKMVDRMGGHLRIRKEDGVRYLDLLGEYPNTNTQVIRFGSNLLVFTKTFDMTDFATVVVPLGAPLEESPIEALTAYLDVSSVNDGSIYVPSQDAVDQFGWIEKVVHWDDITIASNLLRKARAYLTDNQFENMQLEVSAMDLHYLNTDNSYAPVNYEYIKLLDRVRVISEPHGLDRYFPVTKLTIPLANPENAVYFLGTTVKQSLTKAYSKGGS